MLRLRRIALHEAATMGVLIGDDELPLALTLERPWRNNARTISCIPSGSYACRRVISPKFGETFEVANVPGRTHILLHKGNTAADTEGCIILGQRFGTLNGQPAVLMSAQGFCSLMDALAGRQEFQLLIENL